jgi:hypothetical protein
MHQKAHAAIRGDPAPKAKADTVTKKRWTAAKIELEARKLRLPLPRRLSLPR